MKTRDKQILGALAAGAFAGIMLNPVTACAEDVQSPDNSGADNNIAQAPVEAPAAESASFDAGQQCLSSVEVAETAVAEAVEAAKADDDTPDLEAVKEALPEAAGEIAAAAKEIDAAVKAGDKAEEELDTQVSDDTIAVEKSEEAKDLYWDARRLADEAQQISDSIDVEQDSVSKAERDVRDASTLISKSEEKLKEADQRLEEAEKAYKRADTAIKDMAEDVETSGDQLDTVCEHLEKSEEVLKDVADSLDMPATELKNADAPQKEKAAAPARLQKACGDALEKVADAKEAVQVYREETVSTKEIERAGIEHSIAFTYLSFARTDKDAAERALLNARDALACATDKLEQIRKRTREDVVPGGSGKTHAKGGTGNGGSNIEDDNADNGTDAEAVQGSSETGTAAVNPAASVLGATRKAEFAQMAKRLSEEALLLKAEEGKDLSASAKEALKGSLPSDVVKNAVAKVSGDKNASSKTTASAATKTKTGSAKIDDEATALSGHAAADRGRIPITIGLLLAGMLGISAEEIAVRMRDKRK